jgi:micrococcal nuclease
MGGVAGGGTAVARARGAAVLLGALLTAAPVLAGSYPPPPPHLERGVVTRVSDGDTVSVRLGRRTTLVRLIGVDTPELHDSPKLERQVARGRSRAAIVAMGERARTFTSETVLGRTVLVEDDVKRSDAFGRRLAYLWLRDGTLVNGELVRAGYARVLTIPPNVRYAALLLGLEREARRARRGLWAEARTGNVSRRRGPGR